MNFSNEQIISKWGAMIKHITGLKTDDDIEKVSVFAHNFAMEESIRPIHSDNTMIGVQPIRVQLNRVDEYTPSLLPINLNVIAKIKDLSKVEFMNGPIIMVSSPSVETNEHGDKVLKLNQRQIKADDYSYQLIIDHKISGEHGFYWLNEIEKYIVEEVANKINQSIEAGNTLYIYQPVSTIQIVNRFATPTDDQEIRFQSRMKEVCKTSVSLADI